MSKNPIKLSATLLGMALVAFTSCEDQDFTDVNNDATRVEVNTISAEMAKVRDYVPPYAVMAHRGSTFWAPEETESAWRWAREWVWTTSNPTFSVRRTVLSLPITMTT